MVLFRVTSVLVAAVPFAFALVRAVRTGNDLRYLWVALASLLGAAVILGLGGRHARGWVAAIALAASAFVSATVFAVPAALLQGTTWGPGILVVAASFGLCFAASCLLHLIGTLRGGDEDRAQVSPRR